MGCSTASTNRVVAASRPAAMHALATGMLQARAPTAVLPKASGSPLPAEGNASMLKGCWRQVSVAACRPACARGRCTPRTAVEATNTMLRAVFQTCSQIVRMEAALRGAVASWSKSRCLLEQRAPQENRGAFQFEFCTPLARTTRRATEVYNRRSKAQSAACAKGGTAAE